MKGKELINRYQEAKKRDYENGSPAHHTHARTSVYIPVTLVREELVAYSENWKKQSKTYQDLFPSQMKEETAIKEIKQFINYHWVPVKVYSGYSIYKNTITGETKKLRK